MHFSHVYILQEIIRLIKLKYNLLSLFIHKEITKVSSIYLPDTKSNILSLVIFTNMPLQV